MRKFLFCIFCLVATLGAWHVYAQDNSPTDDFDLAAPKASEFFKAKVTALLDEGQINDEVESQRYQSVRIVFLNGYKKNQELEIKNTSYFPGAAPQQKLRVGDKVIVSETYDYNGNSVYQITDRYRVPQLYFIAAFFVALALWLGRKRGATSLVGLLFSIAILGWYIVPRILAGDNPFLTTLVGSIIIVTVSLYLAHGFNHRTSIALLSTSVTLALAIALAVLFVHLAKLFGLGTEDAYFLIAANQTINLQGLLLGGIIIGTLGVLDDITTAQTAVVAELKRAKPDLSRHELYKRSLTVGHEHIASLVNTLVLAYAGTSLPIFLLFTLNRTEPIWTILNSEFVAEEIVRTLVGSSALVMSVPIATWIATWALTRWPKIEKYTENNEIHHH